jgi:hypothetical protein
MRDLVTIKSTSPEATREQFVRALEKAVLKLRPAEVELRPEGMLIRGGVFRPVLNWNLLAPVGSANVDASVTDQSVVVKYELLFTEYATICGVFSASFLLFTIVRGGGFFVVGLVTAACIWLIFLGTRLMTRFRFRWFIRRILRQATQQEPQM